MSYRKIWSRAQFEALSPEEQEAIRHRAFLSDFYYPDVLIAVCAHCRESTVLRLSGLKKRFGNRRIVELEKKLRCRACGNKRGNRFFAAAFHDDE